MRFNAQKRHIALVGVFVVLFGGFLYLLYLASPKFTEAHYTLARGCKGHLRIIANCPDGVELRQVNGTYMFYIPKNGVLKLKHSNPLGNTLVEQSASLEDGTPIPMPHPHASEWKKGQHALIGGSGNEHATNYFFGTREEYEKAFWKLPH